MGAAAKFFLLCREVRMVFLDVLIPLGCRRWLHKEDFKFDEQVEANLHEEDGSLRQVAPSEYFMLGFKDRVLEDEYLENLVLCSQGRILLGYAGTMCLLLFGPVLQNLFGIPFIDILRYEDTQAGDTVAKIYVPSLSVLILFGACSATSIVFFNWERCKQRRVWVVYITGAAYLIAIAVIGYDFSRF